MLYLLTFSLHPPLCLRRRGRLWGRLLVELTSCHSTPKDGGGVHLLVEFAPIAGTTTLTLTLGNHFAAPLIKDEFAPLVLALLTLLTLLIVVSFLKCDLINWLWLRNDGLGDSARLTHLLNRLRLTHLVNEGGRCFLLIQISRRFCRWRAFDDSNWRRRSRLYRGRLRHDRRYRLWHRLSDDERVDSLLDSVHCVIACISQIERGAQIFFVRLQANHQFTNILNILERLCNIFGKFQFLEVHLESACRDIGPNLVHCLDTVGAAGLTLLKLSLLNHLYEPRERLVFFGIDGPICLLFVQNAPYLSHEVRLILGKFSYWRLIKGGINCDFRFAHALYINAPACPLCSEASVLTLAPHR